MKKRKIEREQLISTSHRFAQLAYRNQHKLKAKIKREKKRKYHKSEAIKNQYEEISKEREKESSVALCE